MNANISPARQKMIEVMTLKGQAPATQENDQRSVSVLLRDCGRAPQNLIADEISAWVFARIDRGLCPRTTHQCRRFGPAPVLRRGDGKAREGQGTALP